MNLGDARLARLWVAAHRRLERTGGAVDGVSIRLTDPTDDERAAVDRLLGRRSRGRDLTVRLVDVDAALRRAATTLLDVVASRVGPVRDLPGERASSRAADEALWDSLHGHAAVRRHPPLTGWLDALRASGQWRRLDDSAVRLCQALDVLAALPAADRTSRRRLAVDILGSSHALDDSAPAGRLVTRALAHLAATERVFRAAGRRRLWSSFGVTADETSSTVLTSGLRPFGVGPVTEAAARWADARVPLVVPLVAVDAEPWRLPPGERVWMCENPEVLAAGADRGRPMICVEGWLSLAAERLIASLGDGGARLGYHGDFGSGGIAIANAVIGELGAEPWRMSARDHAEALSHARSTAVDLPALRGPVPAAVWDPDLAAAINTCGFEVEEELALPFLLDDLGVTRADRPAPSPPR